MDITTALSPEEVQRLYFKFTKQHLPVIMYEEISDTNNIREFLDENPLFVLYYPNLVEGATMSGHYTAVIFNKSKNTLYFWDSYGQLPDTHIPVVGGVIDPQKLYDRSRLLIDHVLEAGINVDYSNQKNQLISNNSATCGRWSVTRIMFHYLTNDQFNYQIKKAFKKYGKGLDNDELITIIIS